MDCFIRRDNMWGIMLFITKKNYDMSWIDEFLQHESEIAFEEYKLEETKEKALIEYFYALEEYCYDNNAENGVYDFPAYKD